MSSPEPPAIIVIDDEQELVSIFKEFLERTGYNVISFTDPFIALEYFKNNPNNHSLVITDFRMPRLNGLVLAKNIRMMNDKIRIFLMTAFDMGDLYDKSEFTEAKIDKILQKPIRFSYLKGIIKEAIDQ